MKVADSATAAKSLRKESRSSRDDPRESWIDSSEHRRDTREFDHVHLTRREREVLALLCEGASNKVIAGRLRISSGTVKVHISNIFRALQVSNRLQAVLAAGCGELVTAPQINGHRLRAARHR
jgi:two-component system nitrate/nitrite response regulator NarL